MTRVSDAALAQQRRAEAERRRAAEEARRRAAEKARAEAARAAAAKAKAKAPRIARDEMSVGMGRALREGAKKQLLSGAAPTGAPVFRSAATPAATPAPVTVDVGGTTSIGPSSASTNIETRAGFVAQGRGGVGVSGSVTLDADLDAKVEHEDGFATVTISASASATASGELDLRAVSVGGSVSAGANATYTVRMSDEDFERMKAGEIPVPNPLNPDSIPDGGSVRLDQAQFVGTSLEAGLEYHGVELSVGSESTESNGTSLLVERNDGEVQVTAGPTEVLETNTRLSLGYGPVSLNVGVNNELSHFNLRTATFDLSSNAGQEAFDEFAQSGRVPEENGAGVSNAAFVETLGLVSSNDVDLRIGPVGLDLGGYTNTGNNVFVTYADGTSESTGDLRYEHGPQLTIQSRYDAEGAPIPGTENFTFTFDSDVHSTREVIAEAFSGNPEVARELADRGPVRLSLDAADFESLQRLAHEVQEANPTADRGGLLQDLADAETPFEAAVALARADQGGASLELFQLFQDANSTSTSGLPGSLT
jgi:hypothetical protein